MKILHVIDSLGAGGAEWQVVNTCNFLQEHEHVVCYFQSNISLLSHFNKAQCIHIKKRFLILRILGLRKHIKSIKPDIIHSSLIYSTIIARIAKPKKIKFIFSVQSILSKDAFDKNFIYFLLEKLTYKKDQNIIAVSPAVLDDYRYCIGIKGKSSIVYNTILNDYYNVKFNIPDKPPEILKLYTVGNLKKLKNHTNLIRAVSKIENIKIELTIYGVGDLENELKLLIKKLNQNVILAGHLNNGFNVINKHNVFILPSLYEGCSLSALEAMAAGIPCLFSEVPGLKDLGKTNAFYFNPTSIDEIKNAIIDLYFNWSKLSILSEKNKKRAIELAGRENFINKINQVYNDTSY